MLLTQCSCAYIGVLMSSDDDAEIRRYTDSRRICDSVACATVSRCKVEMDAYYEYKTSLFIVKSG